MSEWTIWAGTAHRMPAWCLWSQQWYGQGKPLLSPFVLSFLGLRYRLYLCLVAECTQPR